MAARCLLGGMIMAKHKTKGVLQDHKRIGKRFVPPLLQLQNVKDVSFIKQLFPHLVWMGLINHRFDYAKGVRLAIDLAKVAHSLFKGEKHVNFALCGNYSLLPAEAKSEIVAIWEKKGWLNGIRRALAPLTLQYDDFPMAFLGIGDIDVKSAILLQELKQTVGKCINKYATPGFVLQTNLVMVQAATGGLRISQDIKLPDFDSIIKEPNSEAAKRAAAFVRAGSFAMCVPDEHMLEKWSKSFWNQGLKVDSCSFSEDGDG
jgi:hypothetical protein